MAAIELALTPLYSDADLVAYYKLEDATDDIGSNDLTNNGGTTFTSALFNNGANMGVTADGKWVYTNTNFTAAYNTPTTVVGWVKMTTDVSAGKTAIGLLVYSFVGNPGRGFTWVAEWNGGTPRIKVRINSSGNDAQQEYYTTTLGTTNWHHFATTSDGTTLITYFDGVAISAGVTLSGTMNLPAPALSIGDGIQISSGSTIQDDVAVFKRVLTATEIDNLYNGTFATSNVKTINGVTKANVKTKNGVAIASIQTFNGLE